MKILELSRLCTIGVVRLALLLKPGLVTIVRGEFLQSGSNTIASSVFEVRLRFPDLRLNVRQFEAADRADHLFIGFIHRWNIIEF